MYDEHYGLTGRPFQLTPDPRFWFDTTAHKKAMSYLGYGLSQGEGFIVITGDVGAGKTTLMGHLIERIDRERLHAITIASTQIEPDDLLRIVAAGLDVAQPGATKADLLTAIERGLHAVARSGRRTLLIVDEAQALPASALEELRMLSNVSANGHALLQIFLLGQPEFRGLLEGPGRLEQLRQRVIALHHLDPMGIEEVEPYMAHRLALVGWNGAPRFTDAAFEALHRGSGGVPRLLNQLAGRTMLFGAIEGLDTIDADAVEGALSDIARDLPQPLDDAPAGPVAQSAGSPPSADTEPDPGPAPLPFQAAEHAGAAYDRLAERIAALETRAPAADLFTDMADHAARLAILESQPSPDADHIDELANRVAALESKPAPVADDHFAELAERLSAVEAKAGAALDAGRPFAADIAALGTRVVKVEKQAGQAAEAAHPAAAQVAGLNERLGELEALVAENAAANTLHRSALSEGANDDARIAALESRIEDQDATLRRMLTLMIDWVEADKRPPVPPINLRA